jgi:hypothetical protein
MSFLIRKGGQIWIVYVVIKYLHSTYLYLETFDKKSVDSFKTKPNPKGI